MMVMMLAALAFAAAVMVVVMMTVSAFGAAAVSRFNVGSKFHAGAEFLVLVVIA